MLRNPTVEEIGGENTIPVETCGMLDESTFRVFFEIRRLLCCHGLIAGSDV
ncbi:MAG: hypothetical protein ACRYHA_03370 [Janthinobacterium lividum]